MSLFLITYDLIKKKDYPSLIEALEKNSAQRIALSTWLINVKEDWTPQRLCEWLESYVDQDDRIVVARTTKTGLWYRNAMTGTNDWLKDKT